MGAVLRRPVVPVIVGQHIDELAVLSNTRRQLTRSAHVALRHLARLDERIAAHVDGAVIAGPFGINLARERLAGASPGHGFAAAVLALEAGNRPALDDCLNAVEAVPDPSSGLRSALGWVDRERLTGVARNLLESTSSFRRLLGLTACRLHGVAPGQILVDSLSDTTVRAEALRTVGTLGRTDLFPPSGTLGEQDAELSFWAVWSSVLLGGRNSAPEVLSAAAAAGPHRERAFRLSLQAMTPLAGHSVLQHLRHDASQRRWLIQGSGIVGDPGYVPWLISLMCDEGPARIAGESFTLITGADLAWLDLERKPPENFESGPNDDPDDPNVEMDPDDGLPWPDPEKIKDWWARNCNRFTPGQRYFMGAPVTREHCIDVLKNGYQRQRILAAHYLCLLEPGTPLFNTSAPAWRQQRLLAGMK